MSDPTSLTEIWDQAIKRYSGWQNSPNSYDILVKFENYGSDAEIADLWENVRASVDIEALYHSVINTINDNFTPSPAIRAQYLRSYARNMNDIYRQIKMLPDPVSSYTPMFHKAMKLTLKYLEWTLALTDDSFMGDYQDSMEELFDSYGFKFFYGAYWKKGSAMDRATRGEIPLTPQVFNTIIPANWHKDMEEMTQAIDCSKRLHYLPDSDINKGHKPWDNEQLIAAIDEALGGQELQLKHITYDPEDNQIVDYRSIERLSIFYLIYARISGSDAHLPFDKLCNYNLMTLPELRNLATRVFRLPYDLVKGKSKVQLCTFLKTQTDVIEELKVVQDDTLDGKKWVDIITGQDPEVTWIPDTLGNLHLFVKGIEIDYDRIPDSHSWLVHAMKHPGSEEYLTYLIQKLGYWTPGLKQRLNTRDKIIDYILEIISELSA